MPYQQRADLIGTQIITRDTGKRLGVVSQIWVDVDRREVVAIGLRENILSGVVSNVQQVMLLVNIRQIGDVILVDDNDVIEENFNTEAFSTLINSEVITETGDMLGKVRGFKFDPEDGRVESIVIASLGYPQIPDQIISTYELSMDEVVSSGPDRLIVFEGSEEKLMQLSVGLLERVGIGKPPWERDDDDIYVRPAAPANQLPSGIRTPVEPMRSRQPAAQETWDEDNWQEVEPRREREPLRQAAPYPEAYAEPDRNWQDDDRRYADAIDGQFEEVEEEVSPLEEALRQREAAQAKAQASIPVDEDIKKDVWEDDENPAPYRAPQVNIPERKRVVEYEEETDY